MELTDFIKSFAEQFDDTSAGQIKADTEFHNLDEWSSMTALAVIAMADGEYNTRLSTSDIRNATTVQDLFNIVSGKQGK